MRYQDFIEEVRAHIKEAQRIRAARLTHKHEDFRRWRQRVESLVKEVAAHGYRLPGSFDSTSRFYTDFYVHTDEAAKAALAKDITDTENELSYLVEQFEKYGVPPLVGGARVAAPPPQLAPPELPIPERVTLYWLFKHVSVGGWIAVGGAAITLLLVGAAIGKTGWFGSIVSWFTTSWPR
jgi:hypothetical protein